MRWKSGFVVAGLAVASTVVVTLGAGTSAVQAALPSGFSDTPVPISTSNPLRSPTTIVSLNGGRALVLEKAGAVRIVQPDGTLSFQDAMTLPVCSGGEMGLLGAAVDPQFQSNGSVYLYYTRSAGNCGSPTGRANRVSRFTMTDDTIASTSEVVLLDNIPATGGNHNGGDLEVGQDGFLYVAVGDAGTNPRGTGGSSAQDLSLLTGKILRIGTDGSAPADNPFSNDPNATACAFAGVTAPPSARCIEIYSYGLRNPYRFAFDPNTGATRFFINDVGQNAWEEVNDGIRGANYGWNAREGFCVTGSTTNCPPAPAGVTDPLTSYPNADCSFITGGAFVPNGVWPKQFDGAYLFADGGCDRIFIRNGAGVVDYANPFHQASGTVVDMAFVVQGNDPALFYVTVGDSMIRKITYDAPAAATSPALAYTPLAAANRAYDTRLNIGVAPGTVRANTTRLVDLGITDPAVKAALVNITMDAPFGATHVTASEPRTEFVATSNLNAAPGDIVANASIVPVDADGNLLFYVSNTTHVIIDVLGTFGQIAQNQAGGRYTSLTPQRLIDTREPVGSANTFTRSGLTVNAPLAGRAGVPSAVTAVALIVTGLSDPATGAGFVTVYPHGAVVPPTSNLNVNGSGDIRPNLVVVPLGADGSIDAQLVGVANAVIDVAGYFSNGSTAAGLYHVIAPSRQVDSRTSLGFGTVGTNGTKTFTAAGAVPGAAVAISQNVTITNPAAAGFVTAYPAGSTLPVASNANSSGPGQDRAALTITRRGAGGAINYYSSSGTDLVVDITGYFD